MSALTTSEELRRAIDQAVTKAEQRKAEKDACPNCKRPLALVTLSFRGAKLGCVCRFCRWVSPSLSGEKVPDAPKAPKTPKKAAAKKAAAKKRLRT